MVPLGSAKFPAPAQSNPIWDALIEGQGQVTDSARRANPGLIEFIVLMALMVSLVALSTDAMLPALGEIGTDLGVARDNDTQLVVTALFLGFAVAQLLYGPLSDSIGSKPAIYLGVAIFVAGCLMSIFATDFSLMLAGRVLQGIGAAGPRIVIVALVRDGYGAARWRASCRL